MEKDTFNLQVSDVSGFMGKGIALYLTRWVSFTAYMISSCFSSLTGFSVIHLIYPEGKWMMQLKRPLWYGVM